MRTGDGNDTLDATTGDDTLYGGNGDDLLTGVADNDQVFGGSGKDTLLADYGNDYLDGGQNNDAFGGEPLDQVNYINFGFDVGTPPSRGLEIELSAAETVSVNKGSYGTDTLVNFEELVGSSLGDTVKIVGTLESTSLGSNLTFLAIDARENLDVGDMIDLSGVTGAGVNAIFEDAGSGLVTITQGSGVLEDGFSGYHFENLIGTSNNDTVSGNIARNEFFGGGGDDSVDGGAGHDNLHAGLGNDTLEGGDGADVLLDNGASRPQLADEDTDAYNLLLEAYDGAGNDVLYGGAGADFLVHSGGNDTFYGGAGDDTYLVVPRPANTNLANDNLTIVVSEGTEPNELFGHDIIAGNGRGVDLVFFEGINSDDVQIIYHYDANLLYTSRDDYDNLFPWSPYFPATEINHFSTVGSIEFIINATGSSLVVQQVFLISIPAC